jgi:hypothetical protein
MNQCCGLCVALGKVEMKVSSEETNISNEMFVAYLNVGTRHPMNIRPCPHGMARPQVADRGNASDMEGSCE